MGKRISVYNEIYWTNKGFTKEEAIKKIEKFKKENSCWNKEFWINKKGYTEEEAINKVKEIQSRNSKKQDKTKIKNIYLIETWIDKGFTKEEAINKVNELKDKSNIYKHLSKEKLNTIKNNRSKTFYSKTKDEINRINKKKGRTKEELIEKFGKEKTKKILYDRGKGRRNSFFKRYSKISENFFNELNLILDKEYKLLYAENEKWIRCNKNNGFFVDLIVENTNKIIEFNGDFYHANPKIYESNSEIIISKNKKLIAKEIWEKDKERIKKLNELGYNILIIWEHDVLINKEEILTKCVNFIKNE